MIEHLESLWTEALEIWGSGGWAMPALAINALAIFWLGCHVWLRLRVRGFEKVPEKIWRLWINHPSEREGPIGEILDFVTGAPTLDEIATRFSELRATETAPFERDLRLMRICVTTAPLLGLLGTVTGMLTTFGALSTGSGGEKTMLMVSSGISEALITTETGLVIALPGLFFRHQLQRRSEMYKAFLAHVETVCTQHLHRRLQLRRAAA